MKVLHGSRWALGAAAFALALTACTSEGPGAPSGSNSATASGGPQKGGTLTVAYFQDYPLDPAQVPGMAGGSPGAIDSAIYDTLVSQDSKTGEVRYRLAESMTPNTDFTEWSISLRPGVKFSDGSAFDAAAVKANWDRVADPATKSPAAGALAGATVSVVDPVTVKVDLKVGQASFPAAVANNLALIASPASLKGDWTKPIGAGPFMVESKTANSQLVLVRNPTYWQTGKPYLDKLVFKIIPDAPQGINTVASGAADAIYLQEPANIPAAEQANLTISKFSPSGGNILNFQNQKAPFTDPAVRKAIAQAIDFTQMASTTSAGQAEAATTLFISTSPFYDASATQPGYDAGAAQKFFDDYAAKNGKPLEFTLTTIQALKPAGDYVAAALAKYKNLKVTEDVVETGAGVGSIFGGDYQAAVFGAPFLDPDPLFVGVVQSENPKNTSRYSNPKMDTLLAAQGATTDTAARATSWLEAQKLFMTDLPFIYTTRQVLTWAGAAKVKGLDQYFALNIPYWDQVSLEP